MVVYTRQALATLSSQEANNCPNLETSLVASPTTPRLSPYNVATSHRLPTPPPASFGDENAPPPSDSTLHDPSSPTDAPAAVTPEASIPPSIQEISPSADSPVMPSGSSLDSAIAELASAPATAGAAFASNTSVCSNAYKKKKERTIREFRDALKKMSPKYDPLLKEAVDVPTFFKQKKIESVFVMLSGQEERRKKVQVLNEMLIDWIAEKSNKNGGFPTPATITNAVQTLLAATKDQFNWDFSLNDFKFDGGFNGFFKHLCAERQRANVSKKTAAQLLSHAGFSFHSFQSLTFFPFIFNLLPVNQQHDIDAIVKLASLWRQKRWLSTQC